MNSAELTNQPVDRQALWQHLDGATRNRSSGLDIGACPIAPGK